MDSYQNPHDIKHKYIIYIYTSNTYTHTSIYIGPLIINYYKAYVLPKSRAGTGTRRSRWQLHRHLHRGHVIAEGRHGTATAAGGGSSRLEPGWDPGGKPLENHGKTMENPILRWYKYMECNTRMCENGETKAHDVDEICLKHMAHLWHHSKNTSWLGYHGIPWTSDGPRSNATLLFTASVQDPGSPQLGFWSPGCWPFSPTQSPRMLQVRDYRDNGCASRFSFGGFLAANGPTVSTNELVSF